MTSSYDKYNVIVMLWCHAVTELWIDLDVFFSQVHSKNTAWRYDVTLWLNFIMISTSIVYHNVHDKYYVTLWCHAATELKRVRDMDVSFIFMLYVQQFISCLTAK